MSDTIKVLFSHQDFPGFNQTLSTGSNPTYNSVETVFFELPSNVTIYFSNPGIGCLALSESQTENKLIKFINENGINFLNDDPAYYGAHSGTRLFLEKLGYYNRYFVDFNISFEDDRNVWNMWSKNTDDDTLSPYRRWSSSQIYSLKDIIDKFPKSGFHTLVIQACNPYLDDSWSGVDTIQIQRTWSEIMTDALEMQETMRDYMVPKQTTRSTLRHRGIDRSGIDTTPSDDESPDDLWEREKPDRKHNFRKIAKAAPKVLGKNKSYEGVLDIMYSKNRCLCKGPCIYQNWCDQVMGTCMETKKCLVDPEHCGGLEFDYCK